MKFKIFISLLFCGITLVYAQDVPLPASDGNTNVIKELYFSGLRDKLAENYSKATSSFNKIIAIDPNNAAAYFELASLNFRQKNLLDAETAIKKAISLDSKNSWYLKLQAEIYKRNGNMDALVQVFTHLIALSPESIDLYFDRANAYLISGKIEEAKRAYDAIELKFGASAELTAAKQRLIVETGSPQSEAAIQKMVADNPGNVQNYLYLSELMLKKNNKGEALAILLKAKTTLPDSYELDLAIADIYQSDKKNELAIVPLKSAFANSAMPIANKVKIISQMLPRFGNSLVAKDAMELVQIAVKTHPDDNQLTLLYGDVLYQQGSLKEAKSQYQLALKTADQLYPAWEKLLAIQTLLGEYTEAIKTGDDALNIYPNQAILYYYHAFALHRNGQNAEAALDIKSALQLDADDNALKAMIFALQAEVFIDQEKLKEADLAFDKAIALAPDNYLTLSNYAYYLALGNQNLSKAEALASKAATAMPKNASVLDTYAIVLFKLGKYDQAQAFIQKALQNNEGSNPVYLEHYGDILFLKGDKEAAVLQWQKAKQAGNASEKLNKKINEKKYIK